MPAEITVTVKNEEKKQSHKHLVYEDFVCNSEDERLKYLVDEAVKEFNAEPDDIVVKIVVRIK